MMVPNHVIVRAVDDVAKEIGTRLLPAARVVVHEAHVLLFEIMPWWRRWWHMVWFHRKPYRPWR
jgi:hypothetical protein